MNSTVPEILLRIAVVEDDRDLRDTTLEYLWTLGYPAWGAGSAEEFYKRFATEIIDVVVLDIRLPGEDGISVARHLRELPYLTFIIVSARHNPDDRIAGLKAGADRYLVKPVNLAELVANIESISRRSTSIAFNAIAERERLGNCWRLAIRDWCLTGPDGKSIILTANEFFLLNFLFEARGEPVPRKTIAIKIFGHRVLNSSERLDVLLARLRKKILTTLVIPCRSRHCIGLVMLLPRLQCWNKEFHSPPYPSLFILSMVVTHACTCDADFRCALKFVKYIFTNAKNARYCNVGQGVFGGLCPL